MVGPRSAMKLSHALFVRRALSRAGRRPVAGPRGRADQSDGARRRSGPDDGAAFEASAEDLGRAILRGEWCETRRGGFTVLDPAFVLENAELAYEERKAAARTISDELFLNTSLAWKNEPRAGATRASHESLRAAREGLTTP